MRLDDEQEQAQREAISHLMIPWFSIERLGCTSSSLSTESNGDEA